MGSHSGHILTVVFLQLISLAARIVELLAFEMFLSAFKETRIFVALQATQP